MTRIHVGLLALIVLAISLGVRVLVGHNGFTLSIGYGGMVGILDVFLLARSMRCPSPALVEKVRSELLSRFCLRYLIIAAGLGMAIVVPQIHFVTAAITLLGTFFAGIGLVAWKSSRTGKLSR